MVDTKPNLNDSKFEQGIGDILHLSGTTDVLGNFTILSGATFTILPNHGLGKILTSNTGGTGTWQIPAVTGASNGLTLTGNTVVLGGTLSRTGGTIVDINNYNLFFISCGNGNRGITLNHDNEQVRIAWTNSGATCSGIGTFATDCVVLTSVSPTGNSRAGIQLTQCDSRICFQSKIVDDYQTYHNNCGLSYTRDFSASGITSRWIPDKGYVDNLVTGNTAGERVTKLICQVSHGFTVKDVIGWSGGTYNKSIANGLYDGEVLGIVSKCYNVNCFDLTQAGYVTGLTSLSANTTYFLSDVTAGLLTAIQPTGDTHISKAVLLANSTTSGWVLPYPGYIITSGLTPSVTWGTISGNISGQTDLNNCLNSKLDATCFIYNLNSPATCTVGGVTPGYVLTGKTISCILQDAFAPYIPPTFSAFDFIMTTPVEVGTAISGSKTFTWSTTSSSNVSANSIGIRDITGGCVLATGLANDGSEVLSIGTKTNTSVCTWTWRITGLTTQSSQFCRNATKSSIYPYYYGRVTCGTRPAVTNSLITTACLAKPVVDSVGTVTVTFSSAGQWTWLAIPQTSTSKICWYVNGLDNGFMNRGCASDKYPDECLLCISSAEGCWTNICYKVYMSGYAATDASPIQFRNS